MKNFRNIFLVSFALIGFLFVSCSSDDDNTPVEEGLHVEGVWKFTEMNFLDEDVLWDPEIEYISANTFGYAPYMFDYAEVKGFDFGTVPVEDEEGNVQGKRFDYILGGNFGQDPDEAYWYWNYTNGGEAFEAIQVNPSFPPHDYSLRNVSDVVVSNDGNRIDFKGELLSREVGGGMMDTELTPVEFTLVKGEIDEGVDIFIAGIPIEETLPESE
ncbi:MAG TPA: hypothetical protein VK021_10965 [Flavobacteriaceae bacterium]|nr:hypothetical protein [Flavobacteriaceae bacterium]